MGLALGMVFVLFLFAVLSALSGKNDYESLK
jgi:hypothetical protein